MPLFKFTYFNDDGELVSDIINAPTKENAILILHDNKINVKLIERLGSTQEQIYIRRYRLQYFKQLITGFKPVKKQNNYKLKLLMFILFGSIMYYIYFNFS